MSETVQQAPAARPRKKFHLVPALAAWGMVLVLGALYLGVRAARVDPPQPATSALGLQLPLPAGWKQATQQSPQGSDGRIALGAAGARRQALFITRYPLRQEVSDPRRASTEARRWLRQTGARRSPKLREVRAGDMDGLAGTLHADGLTIQLTLLFAGRTEWQLSCQSLPGPAGSATRARCREVLDGLHRQ